MFELDKAFVGLGKVVFVSGLVQILQITKVIRDDRGHPIVLEDVVGSYYNWLTIISITPVPKETEWK